MTVHEKIFLETVRLAGIDCPESDQLDAAEATKILALNKREVTVTPFTTDRDGRTVADVTLQGGRSLTHELVKQGWCWWYRKYAPLNTELEQLEQSAREAKKGLWVDPQPVPPWEWRKRRD
jgi:endonuclease YncB( thermonuclease family)